MKNERFKHVLKDLRKGILMEIMSVVRSTDDNKIDVWNNPKDLVVQVIDFQTQEVVFSIQLKESKNDMEPPKLMASIGVYEEDYDVNIETFGVEFLLEILEVCELVTA